MRSEIGRENDNLLYPVLTISLYLNQVTTKIQLQGIEIFVTFSKHFKGFFLLTKVQTRKFARFGKLRQHNTLKVQRHQVIEWLIRQVTCSSNFLLHNRIGVVLFRCLVLFCFLGVFNCLLLFQHRKSCFQMWSNICY